MGSRLLENEKQRGKSGSILNKRINADSKMGKGQNEGGFSEDQLQMYKDCFRLMDFLERLEVPAPMTTWSRCSKRRWPEMEMTLTTSLSRLSRPMIKMAKLTPRCSHML